MELFLFIYLAGVGAAISAFFTEIGGRADPFKIIIIIPFILLLSWVGYAMITEHRR